VVNGELSREQALNILGTEMIDTIQAQRIRLQIANKLEITTHELESFENLDISLNKNYKQSYLKNFFAIALTKLLIIIRSAFRK
jgi:hypothetical protein